VRRDPLSPGATLLIDAEHTDGHLQRASTAAGPPWTAGDRLSCEPVFDRMPSSRPTERFRVLGIDPGLTRCGYAVVDSGRAGSVRAVSLGVIRTPPADPLPQRLAALRLEFTALLTDDTLRSGLVENAYARARKLDWRHSARQIEAVLLRAIPNR